MNPINPWLDPVEVRRLADHLMKPNREPATPLADAGFGEGFVGYASDPAVPPAATPSPPQVVPTAAPPANTPPPTAENPTTARSPFLDRISRFRDWMRHNFSATGIFILDREGAVIFDESHHGRLHFLARSLALCRACRLELRLGSRNVRLHFGRRGLGRPSQQSPRALCVATVHAEADARAKWRRAVRASKRRK